ncbi:MAG: hypothetical protein AOA66_0124 [Candidatus Bathyarchaeota archaeon BA2]|nr:MAG: hypothetical protein AOA66_0124 [Candidatus Bathyarchaeota archaeon BA2]
MTRNWQEFEVRREKPNYLHMSVGVGVATAMFLVYSSLNYRPNETALVSIVIFNFLFIFLIFPLEGSLLRKVFLLISGNLVGLAWYLIQSSFLAVSAPYLEAGAFKVVYVILCPIIDSVWIVSVWSLSLSVLASAQRRKELKRRDGN